MGDQVVAAHAPDGRLQISVSDRGPSGGSGLELAIARAIAEAHEGNVHAESLPAHGARFRLQFPGYCPPHNR